MKAKYLVLIGLFAATMVACSRDEESLFDKPAAQRAQEAITNAFDVLTSNETGWEMAYFPNLEASAKGYNMVLKFSKNGNVSVTAKNSATTNNKIMTDTASTWAVKSDYGPILTFDTYNDVFHAFSDPGNDGAGLLGDYEFLILKATPELVLLKGKKHSAYTVMRPMKNTDLEAYFAACEKMQTLLFGNYNIVTLHQGNEKMYLYNGASGQFQSAAYGSPLIAEAATYHPVCATEDGIIVSTGFGEDIHDHIFYYDSIKGELKSEQGALMNAGELNVLYKTYFTDNLMGWSVNPASIDSIASFLEKVNILANDAKKRAKVEMLGYGYKQSLNMYEGGYFVSIKFSYVTKKNKKDVTQTINLVWTIDIDVNDKGIVVHNLQPYDEKPEDGKPGNAESWIKSVPVVEDIVNVLVDEFTITPSENNLFNAATGMYLNGKKKLLISGSNNVKM